VLLVVAAREQVDPYVAACRQAGIRLTGIDLEAFALLRAFVAPSAPDEPRGDAATVAVAIGHEGTTLAVSDGSVCRFTRVLDWGGSRLDAAIASALDVQPGEATTLKHSVDLGAPAGEETSETARRARTAVATELANFARELVSSLSFYQTQPDSLGIRELIVTGGVANLRGLAPELQRIIGVPVRVGDPLARARAGKDLQHEDDAANGLGSLAVAIGLGIED
jgi:type IV pilus assembly protein PilM